MHATGDYTIADLADLFKVSRPTVYRTLRRDLAISWSPSIDMACTSSEHDYG